MENKTILGKLIGRYFDSTGTSTQHFANVLTSVENMKKVNHSNNHLYSLLYVI